MLYFFSLGNILLTIKNIYKYTIYSTKIIAMPFCLPPILKSFNHF